MKFEYLSNAKPTNSNTHTDMMNKSVVKYIYQKLCSKIEIGKNF